MLDSLVRDLKPGNPLRHVRDLTSGSMMYGNQHWLLHPKYMYYGLAGMFMIQSFLRNGQNWVPETGPPVLFAMIIIVYLLWTMVSSLLILGGTLPIVFDLLGKYDLLKLVCNRTPYMSRGLERWSFAFYLVSATGLVEPLLTAFQGEDSRPSEIIFAAGTSPTAVVFMITTSILKFARSFLRFFRAKIPSTTARKNVILYLTGVLAVTNICCSAFSLISKHGKCLNAAQKVAAGAVLFLSLASIFLPPELPEQAPPQAPAQAHVHRD